MTTKSILMKIRKIMLLFTCFPMMSYAQMPYPQVTSHANGPVIESGGSDMTGAIRTTTPTWGHFETSNDNRVPARLQVAKTDANSGGKVTWSDARTRCTSPWRVPTQRELALIWVMGGGEKDRYNIDHENVHLRNPPATDTPLYEQSGFTPLLPAQYWTSTDYPDPEDWAWAVSFSKGAVSVNNVKDSNLYLVRCVRDL